MDLPQLRAFVTVAEELHFGRAGLRLGLSQPQVSRSVRALEDELGVQLFVRTARRTELTDAGSLLLADAEEALSAAGRMAERARIARRAGGGRVAVAFVWSTLGAYLPALVAAAGERHPQVELAVSQLTFSEILPALRRGDIDLLIARPLWQQSEMVEITLRREPSVAAVPAAHPFASLPSIPYEAMRGQALVALHRSLVPAAYDGMIAAARARGHDPWIVQHVRSAAEALALVAAGVGLYRMPSSAAVPHPGVVYREIEDTPSRLVLIHRPAPSLPVQTIIALAHDLFGDAPGASNDAPGSLEARVAAT